MLLTICEKVLTTVVSVNNGNYFVPRLTVPNPFDYAKGNDISRM